MGTNMSTPDATRQQPDIPPPPSTGHHPSATPASQTTQPASTPDEQQSLLQQQQPSPDAERTARLRSLMYKTSLGICVACPIVALMPPRKMDPFTFGLGIAFFTSAGYAMEHRTGRGLLWYLSSQLPSVKARERERAAREAEEAEAEARGVRAREELRRRWREEEAKRVRERGVLKRLWMGGEGEDWVEKRAEREREAVQDGKGYGGLIVEQVREVFGWKEEEEEDEDDDDEE